MPLKAFSCEEIKTFADVWEGFVFIISYIFQLTEELMSPSIFV